MNAPECEPMHTDSEGWSEWIHPTPTPERGYLMQCCDCGLIHEMQFQIAAPMPGMGDAELNPGEGEDGVVIFRARRWPPKSHPLARMVALDEEMGLYDDGETVPLSPTIERTQRLRDHIDKRYGNRPEPDALSASAAEVEALRGRIEELLLRHGIADREGTFENYGALWDDLRALTSPDGGRNGSR